MSEDKHNNNMLRSYGRRKGKPLSQNRVAIMEDVLSLTKIKLTEGYAPLNPEDFFDTKVKDIWFEIGFGNGEHLVHQAINNPDIGIIGCEPFVNGVSALCKEIREKNIKNIRIWNDDARLLMLRLKKHSIGRVFLLHPDPWPKTKHHKRRFVQTDSLDLISSLLKKGAEFRCATDHEDLAKWMLEKIYFHPNFEWLAKAVSDWQTPPDDWIDTRYCNKGKKKEHIQVYLNFINRG